MSSVAVGILAVAMAGAPAAAWFEALPATPAAGTRFLLRTSRADVALDTDGVEYTERGCQEPSFRLAFRGTQRHGTLVGVDREPGVSNYLIGRSESGWRRGVLHFARVAWYNAYPGIDIIFYVAQGEHLEFDFVIHPGGSPAAIDLEVLGDAAAQVPSDGSLVVAGAGFYLSSMSYAYQEDRRGRRVELPVRFVSRRGRHLGLQVGAHDSSRPLVIDPVLCFSTYVGGSAVEDAGRGGVADAAGNLYLIGTTKSIDHPIRQALQPVFGGGSHDVVVSKLDPGGQLVFSTYLGGSGDDRIEASVPILDAGGNLVLGGSTDSADFPLANPLQGTLRGIGDAFVAALDPTGARLVFSTYLGGSSTDAVRGLAFAPPGDFYVAGDTGSPDLPLPPGAFQTVLRGFGVDAFLYRISVDYARIVAGTLLGGLGNDVVSGLSIDGAGRPVVVGQTESADFPLSRPIQSTHSGFTQGFISLLSTDLSSLDISTFLGGVEYDSIRAVVAEGSFIDVVGDTQSVDFPLVNAFQPGLLGSMDAFVARIDETGPTLVFSSYLGGTGGESALGIATAPGGVRYVTGATTSADFPVAEPLQASLNGPGDAFVVRLRMDGSPVEMGTFFGGALTETASMAAVTPQGDVLLVGETYSADFPLQNALQATLGGVRDAFAARISCWIRPLAGPDVSVCSGGSLVLDGRRALGCPGGLEYQWLLAGAPVCGWSGSSQCSITPPGSGDYVLQIRCQGCTTCLGEDVVRVTVLDDTVPPDQGNVLRAGRQGGDVQLDWAGAAAASWRVYRDLDKSALGSSALAPDVMTTSFVDRGAIPGPPWMYLYRLKGLSPCSAAPGP